MPSGLKPKDLVGIPWRVAFALQADGWYLRQDIIWHKPNPMPESVTDRCTKAHEYIFLLAKSERYYFDAEAVSEQTTDPKYRTIGNIRPSAEGGRGFEIRGGLHRQEGGRETRNRRSVWTIPTATYSGAHFAVMPSDLVKPCILAGCPEGGVVLDPFMGSGTVAAVAQDAGRRAIGIELNPEYCKLIADRFKQRRLFVDRTTDQPERQIGK
jgi:site-specific DNA-methyltransferase (adenine-specific)